MSDVAIIRHYFPELTALQEAQFTRLLELYTEWNEKINVISRKDIENLYINHVLHSLGIAKVQAFKSQARVLDVGTGGGFPGIPLAILFPESSFHLVDSIGKKITVVKAVATALELTNVRATHARAETITDRYDFVVSRAVTRLREFSSWLPGKFRQPSIHELANGILYLKGGDLTEELAEYGKLVQVFDLADYFTEPFFETKKVVYAPAV